MFKFFVKKNLQYAKNNLGAVGNVIIAMALGYKQFATNFRDSIKVITTKAN